jgi:hypothetical protein
VLERTATVLQLGRQTAPNRGTPHQSSNTNRPAERAYVQLRTARQQVRFLPGAPRSTWAACLPWPTMVERVGGPLQGWRWSRTLSTIRSISFLPEFDELGDCLTGGRGRPASWSARSGDGWRRLGPSGRPGPQVSGSPEPRQGDLLPGRPPPLRAATVTARRVATATAVTMANPTITDRS